MDNTDMNDLCFVPYKQNKNTLPKLCCCCCLKLVVTYKETASSVRSGLILKRLTILSVWLRVTWLCKRLWLPANIVKTLILIIVKDSKIIVMEDKDCLYLLSKKVSILFYVYAFLWEKTWRHGPVV